MKSHLLIPTLAILPLMGASAPAAAPATARAPRVEVVGFGISSYIRCLPRAYDILVAVPKGIANGNGNHLHMVTFTISYLQGGAPTTTLLTMPLRGVALGPYGQAQEVIALSFCATFTPDPTSVFNITVD